jgi:aminoglycoside phosphotransferase family enzyme/predicted kinase
VLDWFSRETLAKFSQPDAYPEDPSAGRGVDWIQTHLSQVFLTERRVYKLRKPVDLGFVDFSTRELRNADCAREISLNRRLAPDVYLGVAPLLTDGQRVWTGPISECGTFAADAPEHFVVMRRLREGRDALSLLKKGLLTEAQIERVARRMAHFHARCGLGKPARSAAETWYARCVNPVEECIQRLFAVSGEGDLRAILADTAGRMREFAKRQRPQFEARRLAGRIVDGHGDLHLQHIWFEADDADPVMIDCLEFSDSLRQVDAASEVAFTSMDLRYRGHPKLAEFFLRIYASERDDFDLYSLVDYYVAYRALVRAKVAAIAAADVSIEPGQQSLAAASALRHVELALEAMEGRPTASLILVSGVVGTGKSTVAEALAKRISGVVIASDRVRKQLAGLAPTRRISAQPDMDLYTPDAVERTYAALLERARPVLRSGRVAILDATFSRRRHRAMAADLAADLGVGVQTIEVRCAAEVALSRLAHREAKGSSASDAGPAFYERSVARYEAYDDCMPVDVIWTDSEGWRDSLEKIASDLRR